jgi:hypothetical protein
MGTFTRIAGGAAATAVLLLVAPGIASAGGPTSVLLVSPGRQATASMYNNDESYDRLQRLLVQDPSADPAAPSLKGGPGSDAINVTWLVHDVQIWRVDRIYTDANDGPWVETLLLPNGGSAFDSTGTFHRPADGKELIALLSALKLLGTSPPAAYQGAKAPLTQPVASQATVTSAADLPPAELNWLWLVVGVAAGAVLSSSGRAALRLRRRPRVGLPGGCGPGVGGRLP